MAVTWLGTGAAAASNNAAINLAIPGVSYQAGDLLVAVLFIKENGATWPAPSGWTQASSRIGGTLEYSISVQYRYWQSGDGSFTFTPSGGGSNDTVIGRILAFRGARSSDPIPNFTNETSNSAVNSLAIYSGFAPSILDANLGIAVKLDDSTGGSSGSFVNGFSLTTEATESSVLGSDATLYTAVYAGNANQTTYVQMATVSLPTTTSDFFTVAYVIKANVAYVGSGGVKVGGAATTAFAPLGTYYAPTPSGGGIIGGAATTSLALLGVHFRNGTITGSSGGLGDLTLAVPSPTQEGDLMLLVIKLDYQLSSYSTYPILPAGWTEIAYHTNSQLQLRVGWKVATAGDLGSNVTISFGNDVAGPYKRAVIFPAYNYAMVSGSPVVGAVGTSSSNSSNVAELVQKTTTYPLVKSLSIGAHATASSRTIASACVTAGWKSRLSDSFTGFLSICELDDIDSIPSDSSCTGSTFNATSYAIHVHFGLAGAGTTFNAPTPSGGAIIGGAASYFPPGTDPFNWIASGGVIVAGPGEYLFAQKPFRQLFGIFSLWNSIGLPEGLISGWRIKVWVNSVEQPCVQMTLRRKGQDLLVSLKLVKDLILSEGAVIEGELIYDLAGLPSYSQTIFNAVLTMSRSGSGFTYIEAAATGEVVYGAVFTPSKIMVVQDNRLRVPVDWKVRPGDIYNGLQVNEVTTTVGTESSWFTEVGYG